MTHPLKRAALLTALVGLYSAYSAPARSQELPRGLVTREAQVEFARAHLGGLVEARRRCPPILTRVPPFGGPALGWRVARGRVLTVSRLAEGWPLHEEDVIEVRAPGGQWRRAAPGLVDARQGLAILDTPPDNRALPPLKLGPPIAVGWAGWAVVPPIKERVVGVVSVPLFGKAAPPYTYYWWSPGRHLPAGTPILDLEGRLRAMAGPPLWGLQDKDGTAILPTESLKGVLEGRTLWQPGADRQEQ